MTKLRKKDKVSREWQSFAGMTKLRKKDKVSREWQSFGRRTKFRGNDNQFEIRTFEINSKFEIRTFEINSKFEIQNSKFTLYKSKSLLEKLFNTSNFTQLLSCIPSILKTIHSYFYIWLLCTILRLSLKHLIITLW